MKTSVENGNMMIVKTFFPSYYRQWGFAFLLLCACLCMKGRKGQGSVLFHFILSYPLLFHFIFGMDNTNPQICDFLS